MSDVDLDYDAVAEALGRGALLVDVLPAKQFAWAHIRGARSLPLDELEARALEVIGDKQRETVVYCGGPT